MKTAGVVNCTEPTHCVGSVVVSWCGDLNGDTALCDHVTLVTMDTMVYRVVLVSVLLRLTSQCSLSSSETQFEAKQCSSEHVRSALEETCSCVPRPVVVRLPWPNNTDVHHMTPTHVEVNTRPAASSVPGNGRRNAFKLLSIFLDMTQL